jgi:hypothetical protein
MEEYVKLLTVTFINDKKILLIVVGNFMVSFILDDIKFLLIYRNLQNK